MKPNVNAIPHENPNTQLNIGGVLIDENYRNQRRKNDPMRIGD